jgi:two-component system phosphate regulon response regulator PhoB
MARVLIVEDEADIAELLRFSLELEGHEAALAVTGAAALEQIERRPPDVVLLDLLLPDVPGTEICRRLKADPKTQGIPIVIVSSLAREQERVKALEMGADDFITKPFSIRELVLRLAAVLRRTPMPVSAPRKPATSGATRSPRRT